MERLCKYPPMERQDLNQAQLGSFKFTPVDSAQSVARAYLAEEIAARASRWLAAQKPANNVNVSALSERAAVFPINQASQPGPSPDADFFNTHIKPALAESRLRLGPAALRLAVEDAASPKKRDSFLGNGPEANQLLKAQGDHFPRFHIPNMDPPAAAFVPEAYFVPQDAQFQALPDPAGFCQTFYHALRTEQAAHASTQQTLRTEQVAHTSTQQALSQQVNLCKDLKEQVNLSMQEISSLTSLVSRLRAKYEHNIVGGGNSRTVEEVFTDQTEDPEEAALKKFYREKLGKRTDRLISHGVKEHETGDAAAAKGVAQEAQTVSEDTIDDAHLFNLDLLNQPDFDDSPASAQRRTLRKHFSIDGDLRHMAAPNTPNNKQIRRDRLIDISPESDEGGKRMEDNETDVKGGLVLGNNMSAKDSKQADATEPQLQHRLLTTANPVLELPAAFVAKYSRKPSENHEAASKEQGNGADQRMEIPNIRGFRVSDETTESSVTFNNSLLASFTPQGCNDDDQSTTGRASLDEVQAAQGAPPETRTTLQVGSNLSREPKWSTHKGNPIFDSEAEKWQALGENGIAWLRQSPFSQHPVRYLPEDAAGTTDAYRTVMIDHIPIGSIIQDVLAVVRGGALESIQLLPPIGKATSFMTARIVFNFESAAHNMVRFQEATEGVDRDANRFKVNGVAVHTWMPTDPTYPRGDDLEDEVFGKSRASRILLIGGISDPLYHILPTKVARLYASGAAIEYGWTHDGFASIEFTDIKTALKARNGFSMDRDFQECFFRYDDDYTLAAYVEGETPILQD